jgi:hypothetical protein
MDERLRAMIDAMTREEMCRKWRFAPPGDVMFEGQLGAYFQRRLKKLGGFTPEISKKIGYKEN